MLGIEPVHNAGHFTFYEFLHQLCFLAQYWVISSKSLIISSPHYSTTTGLRDIYFGRVRSDILYFSPPGRGMVLLLFAVRTVRYCSARLNDGYVHVHCAPCTYHFGGVSFVSMPIFIAFLCEDFLILIIYISKSKLKLHCSQYSFHFFK